MFKFTKMLLIAVTLFSATLRADHTFPPGTFDRLYRDTRNLYNSVMYSPLHPMVKQSVYIFARDVENLAYCAQSGRPCDMELEYTHQDWWQVDRYLWDTMYDFPQVYYNYRYVSDDMRYLPHPH